MQLGVISEVDESTRRFEFQFRDVGDGLVENGFGHAMREFKRRLALPYGAELREGDWWVVSGFYRRNPEVVRNALDYVFNAKGWELVWLTW